MKLLRVLLAGLLALSVGFAPAAAQVARPSPGFKSGFKYMGAGGGGGGGATYVRAGLIGFATAGSLTVDFGAGSGLAAGQLIVCYFINNGGSLTATLTGSSTAMTLVNNQSDPSATNNYIFSAIIQAADVTSHSISFTSAANDYGGECAFYSGATTVTYKDFHYEPFPGTTWSFTGFTPAGGTKGAVVLGAQGGNPSPGSSLSAGSGWTQRTTGQIMTPGNPYWEASGILDNTTYSGGSVPVSGFTAVTTNPTAFLIELT